jgi:hypothetical protein
LTFGVVEAAMVTAGTRALRALLRKVAKLEERASQRRAEHPLLKELRAAPPA